jgi:N-acetylmuramoyl-L-alanine amidase
MAELFNVMAVDKLIALSDGHGDNGVTPGKRTPKFSDGKFMYENAFNKAVVKYLDAHLKRCGFRTLLVAPTDADTPLATRTNLADAKGVDLYVSVHANAAAGTWGSWGGTETYVWPSGESKRIGSIIHKHLMGGTPLRDRGVKDGSHLWEIRKPKAPSVLVEAAFMDNQTEAKLLMSDSFRRECALEIAKGICEAYNVKFVSEATSTPSQPKPSTPPANMYRVRKSWADAGSQVGAFTDLQNAIDLAKSKSGYNVYDKAGKQVWPEEVIYRVRKSWSDASSQIGAFAELANAKELADKNPGYTVYDGTGKAVYTYVKPEPQMYRVRIDWKRPETQIGAFSELDNAKDLADKNPNHKVFDKDGKVVYTPKAVAATPEPKPQPTPVPTPKPEPVDEHKGHTPIMGTMSATRDQMVTFLKAKNPEFKDLEAVVDAFISVGKLYGVRGDMAFCQSIIETGWFKFDGGTAVTPDQHNYCGMGVTSKGMKGNSFGTVRDGVTAQVQHLFAYASKLPLPEEKVLDPRYKYVTRGIAPHWEDLSNRWAMNANYGTHIVALHKQLLEVVPVKEEPKPEPKPEEPPVVVEPTPELPVEQPEEEKVNVGLLNKVIELIYNLLMGWKKK